MKAWTRWHTMTLMLVIAATGSLLLLLTSASAGPDPLPAYLQKATFKTSAKCKMCHKAEFTYWAATKHSCPVDATPWIEAGKEKEPISLEKMYRYLTGPSADMKTFAEKGTACEACHGPGSEHMIAKKEEKKNFIADPAKLATPQQQASVCARCHGQYSIGDARFAATFVPGQDLFATEKFKLDDVKADGSMQQMNELATSKHWAKGIACTTCHVSHVEKPIPHQLTKPVVELCTSCHKDITLAAHAPAAKEGDTCATCHMPGGRHTFAAPKN